MVSISQMIASPITRPAVAVAENGHYALRVADLDVFYGKFQAVRGVSFQVEPGEVETSCDKGKPGDQKDRRADEASCEAWARGSGHGRDQRREADVQCRRQRGRGEHHREQVELQSSERAVRGVGEG